MKQGLVQFLIGILVLSQNVLPLPVWGQERGDRNQLPDTFERVIVSRTTRGDTQETLGIGAEATLADRNYVNVSELHYRPLRRVAETRDSLAKPSDNLPLLSLGASFGETEAHETPWNGGLERFSPHTRFGFGEEPSAHQSAAQEGAVPCSEPHVTDASGNYDEVFLNQESNSYDHYRTPGAYVENNDETKARFLVAKVKVSMPMLLPYRATNVNPGGGWYYGDGGFHAGVDFSKSSYDGTDPAFAIHAIADGRVIAKFWDDRAGNILILEHTAPNRNRYRTIYVHLRNGFTHDLQKAQAINYTGGDDRIERYKKFANLEDPSELLWGTDSQKILVNVGDNVFAGQQIAWSGNTGYGGAGWGLKEDGTPTDPNSGNNHLHLYFAAAGSNLGVTDWVLIDPFGVYSNNNAGCYELGKDSAFVRLFAPFAPTFYNVSYDVFAKYNSYYWQMGLAPQTVSMHRSPSGFLVSGSFQTGLSTDWWGYINMTQAEFESKFVYLHGLDYRPRELSVTKADDGTPRFNCIWKKRAGEAYYTFINMNDQQWMQRWNELVVRGKLRVEDYCGYEVNGVRWNAAIYVSDPAPAFAEGHSMSLPDIQSAFYAYYAQGWYLTDLNVTELSTGLSYGVIWRPLPSGAPASLNMTPADFQAKLDQCAAQGLRLRKVQGYSNSKRFAAIWMK